MFKEIVRKIEIEIELRELKKKMGLKRKIGLKPNNRRVDNLEEIFRNLEIEEELMRL